MSCCALARFEVSECRLASHLGPGSVLQERTSCPVISKPKGRNAVFSGEPCWLPEAYLPVMACPSLEGFVAGLTGVHACRALSVKWCRVLSG